MSFFDMNIVKSRKVFSIILPAILLLFLFIAIVFLFVIPNFYQSVTNQKKESIKKIVHVGSSIMKHYDDKHKRGEISLETAQEKALKAVMDFRYGDNNNDYFWINDLNYIVIGHPYRTEFNNKDMKYFKDGHGNYVFQLIVDKIKETNGEGFIEYYWWYNQEENIIKKKISYVYLYKPWGWIIGTGLYFDDLEIEFSALKQDIIQYIILITLFIMVIVIFLLRRVFKAENRVEIYKEYLQSIIDSMPSLLLVLEENGNINLCNTKAVDFFKLKDRDFSQYDVDNMLAQFNTNKQEVLSCLLDRRVLQKNNVKCEIGSGFKCFQLMVYPLENYLSKAVVIIINDITHFIKLQESVAHSEKMNSLGGVAAGMAHEINNPLSGILFGVQNIKRRLDILQSENIKIAEKIGLNLSLMIQYLETRKVFKFLEGILSSGQRANKIVNNMLQFSKKSKGNFEKIEIKKLINDVINIASADYDLKDKYDFRYINIKYEISDEIQFITCVHNEIEQVIFNIIKNAAHAMFDDKTENPTLILRSYLENDYCVLEIENNGPSIPDVIKSKIFDPFFTTKTVGKGTGLGLSVSFFIICDNHKGKFFVESEEGKNTKFIIKLPVDKTV